MNLSFMVFGLLAAPNMADRLVCTLLQSCSHGNSLSRETLKKILHFFLLKNGFQKNQRIKVLVIPLLTLNPYFWPWNALLKVECLFWSQNFRQDPSQQNEEDSFTLETKVIFLNQSCIFLTEILQINGSWWPRI